ncbi:MAG: hypothetical protein ACRERD_16040, partial [Candidatus Binatia bacterium]
LIDHIRLLPSHDQQCLLQELRQFIENGTREEQNGREGPYARSLALAGTAHSAGTDVSADKYTHLAEIYAERSVHDPLTGFEPALNFS